MDESSDAEIKRIFESHEFLLNIRNSNFFKKVDLKLDPLLVDKHLAILESHGFDRSKFILAYGDETFHRLLNYFFGVNEMLDYLLQENAKVENNVLNVLRSKTALLRNPKSDADLTNLLAFFTELFISGLLIRASLPTKLQVDDNGAYHRDAPHDLALIHPTFGVYPIQVKRRTVEEIDESENFSRWLIDKLTFSSARPVFLVLDISDIIIKETFVGKREDGKDEYQETVLVRKYCNAIKDAFNNKTEEHPDLKRLGGVILYGVMYGKIPGNSSLQNVIYCRYIPNNAHQFKHMNEGIYRVSQKILDAFKWLDIRRTPLNVPDSALSSS